MKLKRLAGVAAALLLTLSIGAPAALADDTTATADVSLTILANQQFSVTITDSNDFPDRQFSLGNPGNFSYSAFFNTQVVDMRGTGKGWNVNASASPFTPVLPSGTVPLYSNGLSWLPCAAGTGYCATSGSIVTGVSAYLSSYGNIIGTPSWLIKAAPGISGGQPNGSGTFSTQDVIYYNNLPNALAVGTYTTTITLTLTSVNP